MKRSIEQAFLDLRQQVTAWASGGTKPEVRVFVYPPEWEARVLARFPAFAAECAAAGCPVSLEDVGVGFLHDLKSSGLVISLERLEREDQDSLLHDLGILAERYVTGVLETPLQPPAVYRILVNTGALGVHVSYSAITSALYSDGAGAGRVVAPNALTFPGEGDELSLNLLGLRVDTNYRLPRI